MCLSGNHRIPLLENWRSNFLHFGQVSCLCSSSNTSTAHTILHKPHWYFSGVSYFSFVVKLRDVVQCCSIEPFLLYVQDVVDKEAPFPEVLHSFMTWIRESDVILDGYEPNAAFVTCGDWDLLTMLPNQCALSKIPTPTITQSWINIKKVGAVAQLIPIFYLKKKNYFLWYLYSTFCF